MYFWGVKVHEKYMKRCLYLAKNGLGRTYPNPLVGCVIVYKDKIIGEGWHQKAGRAHAEVNAIKSVKNKTLLKKATLYVNLEPCSHYGKTPPCSQLIIAEKIPHIIIGTSDPNPKVAGKGIQQLQKAGLNVQVGCLERDCLALNKRFFTFQTKKRPYIILKWAQTADGFLAPKTQKQGQPFWITNSYSKQLVHRWRSEEQALLIGKQTALKDNPQLTTRLWCGTHPLRLVIDKDLAVLNHPDLHVLDQKQSSLIFCSLPEVDRAHLKFKKLDFNQNVLHALLEHLYTLKLQSLIVEGGRETLQHFINQNLWDEARVFTGEAYLGSGIAAPSLTFSSCTKKTLLQDQLTIYYPDQQFAL